MIVYLDAIGILGPGLSDWHNARAILRDEQQFQSTDVTLPAIAALPPAERRRTGAVVKLAIGVGMQALEQTDHAPADMATVFTSSGADGDTIHAILTVLTTGACEISPTRFHNSVHNAPSGYWALACEATAPSTSLCGFDGSFAMGLLDAAAQICVDHRPVTLISYDHPYPEPLHAARLLQNIFGVSLVMTPQRRPGSLAELRITPRQDDAAGSVMDEPGLEAIRRDNPAARSLPLLEAVARGGGTVAIEGLENMLVDISVACL
jgi:hypothetical protein